MAQLFAEHEARVSDEIEYQFGEKIAVMPQASQGEFLKKGPDTERPDLPSIVAVIDFEPKMLKSRYGGRNDADTPDLIGEKIHVSIRESYLPYELKEGDLLVFLERAAPYPTRVIVSTTEPDGIGRLIVRCKPGKR